MAEKKIFGRSHYAPIKDGETEEVFWIRVIEEAARTKNPDWYERGRIRKVRKEGEKEKD